jgi:hypothetical protein
VSPGQISVPAQQGPRADNQAQAAVVPTGQKPGQRGQDRPVRPGQPRRPDLALEHGDLVAQEEDLGIFGPVGAGEQGKPAEHAQHCQISQSQ